MKSCSLILGALRQFFRVGNNLRPAVRGGGWVGGEGGVKGGEGGGKTISSSLWSQYKSPIGVSATLQCQRDD